LHPQTTHNSSRVDLIYSKLIKRANAFRYYITSTDAAPWHILLLSDSDIMLEDETNFLQDKKKLFTKDYDESLTAMFANESSVLSNFSFSIKKEALISFQIYTTTNVDSNLMFELVDRDTNKELKSAFFRPIPQIFPVNKVLFIFVLMTLRMVTVDLLKYAPLQQFNRQNTRSVSFANTHSRIYSPNNQF